MPRASGDVADLPHPRLESEQGSLGGRQVAAGIFGHSQQRGGLRAPDHIILGGQRQRLAGVRDRAGDVAQRQRAIGAGRGDRSGQRAILGFVHHDHLRGGLRRRIDPALGVAQPRLAGFQFAAVQQRPRIAEAEHRVGADQIIGQLLRPAQPRRRLITEVHRQPDALDQVRGALEVLGDQRMAGSLRPADRSARTTRSPADGARTPDRVAPPASAPGEHRRRGGDSDTTGADRRAG